MSGGSGGSEKVRILTGTGLAACLLESMETAPIDLKGDRLVALFIRGLS